MTCKICGGPTVGDYPGADIYHMSCLMQTTQHLRRHTMPFFVVDYQLDSGGKEDLRHGPYDTEELAVEAAKNRWYHLGIAVARRIGDELCEIDGSPVCRLEQG